MKLAWTLKACRVALAARYAIANYGPILPPAFVTFARVPPKRKMPYRHTELHQYFVPLVSHFIAIGALHLYLPIQAAQNPATNFCARHRRLIRR